MDISLGERSQLTGRFNFVRDPETGDVAFDKTEAHAVVCSALEDLEGYWADSTHGSELYKLQNLTSRTPSMAEAMVLAAEQPLEQANRVSDVSVEARSARSAEAAQLFIDLHWRAPDGSMQTRRAGV